MKQTNPIYGSISILIGVVIAILALVRGPLEVPLLLTAFAAWVLWAILTQFVPAWRDERQKKQKEEQEKKAQAELLDAGAPNLETAQTLLRHVNHRISAQLKSVFPDAQWEWAERNPALLAFRGGIGRIRIYGVPDFDFADVQLDQSANLKCALLKTISVHPEGACHTQQPLNPQAWYEQHGRKVLHSLIADTGSRGFSRLSLKEDGSICTVLEDGGEITESRLRSFLPKVYWPQLAKVLEQDGLAASVQPDCVLVSW